VTRWIAVVCLLAACGSEKKPKDPPPAPVEIETPTYYRAPGGTAAFLYPTLDDRWKVTLERDSEPPTIRFDFADANGARAQVHVMFPPLAAAPVTAEQTARDAAATIAESVAGTIDATKAMAPSAYMVQVRAESGELEVVSAVIAIVDGSASALVVAIGTEAHLKVAGSAGYADIIKGVSVGAQQPKPPALDPGKPLTGVYISGDDALVFDPRGYVHDDDQIVDLDAMWSIRKGLLDHYTFDGKTVTITSPEGETEIGTLEGSRLQIGGAIYASRPARP
jgi:hypothetical protein